MSPAAHHVIWLFYGHARLGEWRCTVGACEFFSGPDLLAAMEEVDTVRAAGGDYPGTRDRFNTPPDELPGTDPWGAYIREHIHWPDDKGWVAVRVDLGTRTYPDVVQAARDQAKRSSR